MPPATSFKTKPEIALSRIEEALAEGIAPGVVLADAGCGNSGALRDGIGKPGLEFIVGISGKATVWPEGMTPTVPKPDRSKPGRRVKQVAKLAESLPAEAWRTIPWREGVDKDLASRFATLRVRPAQGDQRRAEPRPEHWLLIEWPEEKPAPAKFWLSNLPVDTPIDRLVSLAKLRWLIERDSLELKQELGLGHYEGRGWTGVRHHGALCIAAHGFLALERAAFPPSGGNPSQRLVEAPELPGGFRPRGSPDPDRAARDTLHRHPEDKNSPRAHEKSAAMSMLQAGDWQTNKSNRSFVTQQDYIRCSVMRPSPGNNRRVNGPRRKPGSPSSSANGSSMCDNSVQAQTI